MITYKEGIFLSLSCSFLVLRKIKLDNGNFYAALPVRYLYTTDIISFFYLNTKIIYRIVIITDRVIISMSNRDFLREKGRVLNPNILFVSFFAM